MYFAPVDRQIDAVEYLLILATDMESAKAMADEIAALTQAILTGMDADGNGRVTWQEGEGGLEQAATHLRLMKEAEGLG